MTTCLEHLNRDHQEAGAGTVLNEGLKEKSRKGGFMENAAVETSPARVRVRESPEQLLFHPLGVNQRSVLMFQSEILLMIDSVSRKTGVHLHYKTQPVTPECSLSGLQ